MLCIIQARLGSRRLPGKVFADIAGKPMLAHVVERAIAIPGVDQVVVATTKAAEDEAILTAARSYGAKGFAGDELDVLDRHYQAAIELNADAIIRVTADCPLLDPVVSGDVITRFNKGDVEYATNLIVPTYPDGLDTEVVSIQTLEHVWKTAKLPSEREHVFTHIRTNADLFKIGNVTTDPDYSEMRWTVDEPDDLEFVRAIFEVLPTYSDRYPAMQEIVDLLRGHPEIAALHPDHMRDEGIAISQAADLKGERAR